MDSLQRFRRRAWIYLFLAVALENIVIIGSYWGLVGPANLDPALAALYSLVIGVLLAMVIAKLMSNLVATPVTALWQAVMHLSPTEHGTAAPKIDDLRIGRELVASLTAQIYHRQKTTARHGPSPELYSPEYAFAANSAGRQRDDYFR